MAKPKITSDAADRLSIEFGCLNGLDEIISQYGPSREFGARIKDTPFKHVI